MTSQTKGTSLSLTSGNLGIGAVVIGILAMLGISNRRGQETTVNPPSVAPMPAAPVQSSSADPTAREYLSRQVSQFAPQSNQVPYKIGAVRNDSPTHRARINALVVTIPDPIDTPYAFRHDQFVECLTMAAANADFAVAGHWSPWEMHKALHSRPGAPPVLAPLYERQPGVLLFRRRGFQVEAPEEYLAIFLVGETSNTLHDEALIQSLLLANELRDSRYPDDPIRLIAPFNTGNQDRLLKHLTEFRGKTRIRFHLVSGGAMGLHREDLDWLTLETTLVPALYQQNAAIRFLHERVVDPSANITDIGELKTSVALIVDSNSGFGLSRLHAQQTRPDMRYFRISMHLARLQFQHAQRRRDDEKRLGQSVAPGPPIVARPAQRPNVDVPHSLDEVATPPLVDRSVDDLGLLLVREDIRIVGILVTDPLDRVFLVERVKKFNPNAEIFVIGMDLLYTLPENRHVMRGVVIVSTYPLYAGNQVWTPPQGPVFQAFQNHHSMGYFNAANVHLANVVKRGKQTDYLQRHLAEYSPPAFADNAFEYGGRQPPVWVMTVGENGRMVPHGFYYKVKSSDKSRFPPMFLAAGDKPLRATIPFPIIRQFRYLATATWVLVCILLWWVVFRRGVWNTHTAPENRGWRSFTPMTPHEQAVGIFQQLVLGATIIALAPFISIMLLVLVLPAYPSLENSATGTHFCLIAMLILLAVTELIALFLSIRLFVRFCRSTPTDGMKFEWRARLLLQLLIIVAYTGFGLWFGFVRSIQSPQSILIMDIERSIGVLTGNSPILPLLFLTLGFAVYGYFGLKRHYIGTRFRFDPPYPNPDKLKDPVDKLLSDIWMEAKSLGEMMTTLFGHLRHRSGLLASAAIATLIACISMIVFRCRTLFEHNSWDYLFATGLSILSLIVIITIVRFLDGWKHLKRIMERMAFIPMVRAYDRLPRKAADVFSGYFTFRKPRESHTIVPRHLLAQISTVLLESVNPAPVVVDDLPSVEGATTGIGDLAFPAESFEHLNVSARRLCGPLREHWRQSDALDAFGDDCSPAHAPGDNNSKDGPRDSKGNAAKSEEFVAMLSIIFLSQFFLQLRYLAFAMIIGSLLLMLAVTSYPFQPEMWLMYLMTGILAAVCGTILYVLIGINRDEIYSRITRSTPNRFELNWQFIQTVLTLVGPVILIAAAQFSGRLRDLFTPLLEQLR